jgi:hypothetical protein
LFLSVVFDQAVILALFLFFTVVQVLSCSFLSIVSSKYLFWHCFCLLFLSNLLLVHCICSVMLCKEL